ncbi:MAG: anti-sigma factor [Jiangellaceae bacterium]|nr:anti-sigma factor [Jiangellaceae bacterium]
MRHLGVIVTALVDDQLGHDDRDRALAHVTRCEQCRMAVELERQAKAALRRLPAARPPASLVASLRALAEPGDPLPPPRRPLPGADAGQGTTVRDRAWITRRPPAGRPGPVPGQRRPEPGVRTRRDRVRVVAVGALSAGALTMLLATLGAPATSGSPPASVVPPIRQFTVEHAKATGGLPFAEPAAVVVPAVAGDRR